MGASYGALNGYGCFCSAGSAWSKGRGEAQDEIDEFCKSTHSAYRCLRGKDSQTCDVDNQVYLSIDKTMYPLFLSQGTVETFCQTLQSIIPSFMQNPGFDIDSLLENVLLNRN